MKKSYLISIFFLISMPLFAQNDSLNIKRNKDTSHSLGAGAGFTTGYGISYRQIFNRIGMQFSFAPYYDRTTSRFSTGITLLYTLGKTESTTLYLYQGNHWYYVSQPITNTDPITNQETTKRSTESYVNNGIGFGVEFTVAKNIGLNFMTGYAFYDNFNMLNVTGEIAVYFKY